LGKLKKSYNIMIFSNTGRSFNFELPSVIIKSIIISIVALMVLSSLLIYHYIKFGSNQKQIIAIQKENKSLKNQLHSFNSEINSLKEKVRAINSLGTKLRVMARLNPPKKSNKEGVGGPSFDEVKNFIAENNFEDENVKKLHYSLDRLNFELKQEENNIKELYKYYKAKNIKLSSTPSIWPANGWITSPFGYRRDPFTGYRRFHEGLDISNRKGTPVIAPADGIVVFVGRKGGYGNIITISHGYGITTRYGHLSKILVKLGQQVQRGDIIGKIGNTGRSTGPHLHYEVRINHKPVNPINFILN